MQKNLLGVLLLAACEPSASTIGVPRTDVSLDETSAPSALAPMGLLETTSGSYPHAERATRSVTALVAACLRPVLEREPWLTGSLSYRWDVARPEAMTVGGDLATFAAASCAKDALTKVALVEGASGTIAYDLQLRGTYSARELDEASTLDVEVVGLDPSGPAAEPPKPAIEGLAGTRDALRRCAFGAAPALAREPWFVLGVSPDGTPTLAPSDDDDDEASACMRRVLARARFPTEQRAYGLSVVVARTDEGPSSSVQAEFGMIGLLGSADGDPNAPVAPWGRDDAVGLSDAVGGLTAGGAGIGGGGRGEGIGLGNIGTIGTGAGTGFGGGRLGSSRTKPPQLRAGATSVSGRLPPEVIQRIVRQNFGRFRLCYEGGLRKDPTLAGKVTVSFEISPDGSIGKVTRTTTLRDEGVASCVASSFKGLSFPQPEGGVVKVTYPIVFAPSGDPPPPAATPTELDLPPPPPTVGGRRIASLTMADVEARLKAMGVTFVAVPGALAPGVFVRTESGVAAVFLTTDGHAGSALTTCKSSDADRVLIVRGQQCERVMSPLVD